MPVTFTELLPATKSSRHNGINWTPSATGQGGLLTVHTAHKSVEYLVVEMEIQWDGRAFLFAKTDKGKGTDAESDSYTVYCGRNGQDFSCSCKGFIYGCGTLCKHLNAASALLENETLWGREAGQPKQHKQPVREFNPRFESMEI
jgi:hypothetical protein